MHIEYWLDVENELLYVVEMGRHTGFTASEYPFAPEDIDEAALARAGEDMTEDGWERLCDYPDERFRKVSRDEALALGERARIRPEHQG